MESKKEVSGKSKRGLRVKSPLVEMSLLGIVFGVGTSLYSIGTKNWVTAGLGIVLAIFSFFSLHYIFFARKTKIKFSTTNGRLSVCLFSV